MGSFEITLGVLSLVYSCFVWWCMAGWKAIPEFIPEQSDAGTMLTVIIPARNEEKNISACLVSLAGQDFPNDRYEVIVVDDDSTDTTCDRVNEFMKSHPGFHCTLVPLKIRQGEAYPYKKQAITQAIGLATGKLILTTDADCLLPPRWLYTIAAFYQKDHPVFISAPVLLSGEKTFLGKIQSLEFAGLIGIGAASVQQGNPMMCNGANLAYEKDAFVKSGGYGSNTMASGDDTQLMLNLARQKAGRISFLKSADSCVSTSGKESFSELIQQRIRWSSKIPSQMSGTTVFVAIVAYLLHAGLLAGLLSGYLFSPVLIAAWLMKAVSEFGLLFMLTGFFNKRNLLWYFLPAQLIYPFYITLTGILAVKGTYRWKGRKQAIHA